MTTALVVTGGHPFEADPFFSVFDEMDGLDWEPAAAPRAGFDVVVFYDMPGLHFTRADPPVELVAPTADQREVFDELGDAGTGLVFLHHAIASWPAWEGFATMLGGRFHYQPGRLDGVDYPDSGYRFDVTHDVEVIDPGHPVCAGLTSTFRLTDELYCAPVLENQVVPLMRTRYDTSDASLFFSADRAIRGERDSRRGWTHPPGSDLVAWATAHRRAPIVYLQFGDGPVTYADANYRLALANAINWTATAAARTWAERFGDARET